MTDGRNPESRTVSGLRTRYVPRVRLGGGLLTVAPWIDIVLLIVLFGLLDARLVIQPGVTIRMPEAEVSGGARPRLVAVVLAVGSRAAGTRREIVFFDDVRFLCGDEAQMRGLEEEFAERAAGHDNADLVVQADADIPHGTVMNIVSRALNAGFQRVSLAARRRE